MHSVTSHNEPCQGVLQLQFSELLFDLDDELVSRQIQPEGETYDIGQRGILRLSAFHADNEAQR